MEKLLKKRRRPTTHIQWQAGRRRSIDITLGLILAGLAVLFSPVISAGQTQGSSPTVLDPNLEVVTVVDGLVDPTGMAFIGENDFFVLEKSTGRVQRVVGGAVAGTVLDLPVNFASERGLLSMALHPEFPSTPYVYLFWTESSTGEDTDDLAEVPLRGNRVDRFIWDGKTLAFDMNLIRLRAFQADEDQSLRGNHNGGPLRFGPDGKLYILMGDNGRRGWLQNVLSGYGPQGMDDAFGGPEPDRLHLTGGVLRLNEDGSAPEDNPFFEVGAKMSGHVGESLQKIFAYGHRNGFGLAFDPYSGRLWESENGDDSFDEINRIDVATNGGWVQIMGPAARIAEYKAIETSKMYYGLQQLRWPPDLIADTPQEALNRLYRLPGSHYSDPQFSWRYAVSPAGMGFAGPGLGADYEGDLFVGAATPTLAGGYLFRFKLNESRTQFVFGDKRLEDLVADNFTKYDITESESLLFGQDFGVGTDVTTGPNGHLFVVSLSQGAVYEIRPIAK